MTTMIFLLSAVMVHTNWRLQAVPASAQVAGETYRDSFTRRGTKLAAMGVQNCTLANCHAGGSPKANETIRGDEVDVWRDGGRGYHYRAQSVLSEDRSKVMAKLLYGAEADPTQRPECLACHAPDVRPDVLKGNRFPVSEGVQCESCHGRAEKWLTAHQLTETWRTQPIEQRELLGFYDMRNLIWRTERCLECHAGTSDKYITHDMYAAGHPELRFELSDDLFDVPKHWKDTKSLLAGEQPLEFQARTWAVGQAVALREAMRRLMRWADQSVAAQAPRSITSTGPTAGLRPAAQNDAPDFALFECYACHHDLNAAPNWRQTRRIDGAVAAGRLGAPHWNAATWVACRPLMKSLLPDRLSQCESAAATITNSLTLNGSNRQAVRDAATQLAGAADALAAKAAGMRFDASRIRTLLGEIASDPRYRNRLDFREAEQVYHALFALSYRHLDAIQLKQARGESLYKALEEIEKSICEAGKKPSPMQYDSARFAAALQQVAAAATGAESRAMPPKPPPAPGAAKSP